MPSNASPAAIRGEARVTILCHDKFHDYKPLFLDFYYFCLMKNDYAHLISIVTITYNAANEIRPTLSSIRRQNFKDFEHLIIDGASTDDTLSIAHSEASENMRILSERDNGLYDAMNKGLRLARGKYVIFLNAGDAFHDSSTLDDYAKAALLDYDIIYGDTIVVDSNRNFISKRHLSAPGKLTFKSFSHGMLICHQAFMVKRELAPEYNTNYRFSADYDWTIKCLKAGNPDKFYNLNKVTIDYLTNGLTDKNHKKSLLERFQIMGLHYGFTVALSRHITFIPRAIIRKFSHK